MAGKEMRRQAFTLIEMLMVIATIAVLAALLFPVLVSARKAAQRTTCLSNFMQGSTATMLYLGDYDDHFMLTHQRFDTPLNRATDRTWVQLLLPYSRDFRTFHCPSDWTLPRVEAVFDGDLQTGDTYARLYEQSQHTNLGYNFQYLAPIIRDGSRWTTSPRMISQASDPSQTLLFADSVFQVRRGSPQGGGHYMIVPPCRYEQTPTGRILDSFSQSLSETEFYTPGAGWEGVGGTFSSYGHIWPWHEGKLNIVRLDGSAKTITLESLTAGCSARPNWAGRIVNTEQYQWDLH